MPPAPPPCPMCKNTVSKVTDVPTEPVIWFTCSKCGYSWCVLRDES
jgi:predicted nucleic-acid-binding Zn-ribbon protein